MNSTLTLTPQLLAIIGRRNPAVYDVIPRGAQRRFAEVALNPQPIPPHELGASVAVEIIHAVWLADRLGQNMEKVFDDLDDWCPTVPRHFKGPPWWPFILEFEPHPEWFMDFHLGFAARLAAVSIDSTQLGKSLDRLIERSLSAVETASTRL